MGWPRSLNTGHLIYRASRAPDLYTCSAPISGVFTRLLSNIKMALPHFISLERCAEWATTVEPFLPQLYELPRRLLDNITNPSNLVELYKQTNPLISGFAFSLFLGVVFLAVSEFNRNYSQVDRMWSLLPTLYNVHFKIWADLNNLSTQRLNLIVFWSVVWSVCDSNIYVCSVEG